VSRRPPGRATRQILSGTQLSPSRESIGGRPGGSLPVSPILAYFIVLAALVVIAAIVWAILGSGPASVVVLLLAIGLIASWLVL
jgi:hypothetical protein